MITPNSHMNPVYGKEEIESVTEYITSGGWIMEHTKTREMEQLICDYTGAKYAHMVTSATTGLLVASMVADIKPNERFAVSAYTQAATANGAILMGATPVIIDVDTRSYTIDFENIPDDCRVVFVTSINGRYPDDAQEQIAKLRSQGRFVIEDSAQALGSWHKDKHIGTMGNLGIFSFGAPKIITTGQGGCIITSDEELSKQVHAIKNFGRTVGVGEVYNVMGMNFKFTDIQAAFGVEQMKKLPAIVKDKKEIFDVYREALHGVCDFVDTNLEDTTPTYPEILVDNRDALANYLRENGIGCRAVYYSLCDQPFHRQWKTPTPNTDYIAKMGLHLPGQADLTREDVLAISDIVRKGIVQS
jgi:perosamine synthetase